METKLIAIEEFCTYYNVDFSFIEALHNLGLIEIVPVNENRFLYEQHLKDVEKMVRMHYDLDINIAGIDAIAHLLKRIDHLQQEITVLKNKV
jgi:hypothetical protein